MCEICIREKGGCWFVLFFQAEDGIRDLVRSRGLGDVYKRQDLNRSGTRKEELLLTNEILTRVWLLRKLLSDYNPVSYTHLTLPTSDLV